MYVQPLMHLLLPGPACHGVPVDDVFFFCRLGHQMDMVRQYLQTGDVHYFLTSMHPLLTTIYSQLAPMMVL